MLCCASSGVSVASCQRPMGAGTSAVHQHECQVPRYVYRPAGCIRSGVGVAERVSTTILTPLPLWCAVRRLHRRSTADGGSPNDQPGPCTRSMQCHRHGTCRLLPGLSSGADVVATAMALRVGSEVPASNSCVSRVGLDGLRLQRMLLGTAWKGVVADLSDLSPVLGPHGGALSSMYQVTGGRLSRGVVIMYFLRGF